MAATQNDDARRGPRSQSGSGGTGSARKSGGSSNATANLASAAFSAMSPELLLDLVGRLGLTDMIVSQMRSRVEQLDVDEIFDDLTDYLRRNPEVIVVLLGAITIGTAAIVYFSRVREWDGEERRREQERTEVSRSGSKSRGKTVDSRRTSNA